MENNEQGTPQPEEVTEETTEAEQEGPTVEELQKQLEEKDTQIAALTGKLKRASKPKKEKSETKTEEVPETGSQSSDLDFGQKAYLKSYGISGSDELALVKQFQERGFQLDLIVEDDVFTAKLDGLRQAKETQAAIPKGSKRPGQTGAAEVDLAVAKYRESGELPKDFKLRNEVIDKAIAQKSSSAPFA